MIYVKKKIFRYLIAELVVGINVKGGANFSRKQIDKLTDFVKTPQLGAKGLVYCKCNEDDFSNLL